MSNKESRQCDKVTFDMLKALDLKDVEEMANEGYDCHCHECLCCLAKIDYLRRKGYEFIKPYKNGTFTASFDKTTYTGLYIKESKIYHA